MHTTLRKKPRCTMNYMGAALLIFGMFSSIAHGQSIQQKNSLDKREAPPPMRDGDIDRPHREPPPQAYEACKNKKEGVVVDIVTPREGKIRATCTMSPKGLFARPERPPHPPEAGRIGDPQLKQKEAPRKNEKP